MKQTRNTQKIEKTCFYKTHRSVFTMEYPTRLAAFAILAAACVAARSVPRAVPDCPVPPPGQVLNITFYPNDEDCHQYWECDNGNLFNGTCPDGLVWNPNVDSCDFWYNYNCTIGQAAAGAPHAGTVVSADSVGITCPGPSADGSYEVGFFPHEEDCSKYWRCDHGLLLEEQCAEGLVWLDEMKTCDWEFRHPCEKAPKSGSWWPWAAVKRRTVVRPDSVKKLA